MHHPLLELRATDDPIPPPQHRTEDLNIQFSSPTDDGRSKAQATSFAPTRSHHRRLGIGGAPALLPRRIPRICVMEPESRRGAHLPPFPARSPALFLNRAYHARSRSQLKPSPSRFCPRSLPQCGNRSRHRTHLSLLRHVASPDPIPRARRTTRRRRNDFGAPAWPSPAAPAAAQARPQHRPDTSLPALPFNRRARLATPRTAGLIASSPSHLLLPALLPRLIIKRKPLCSWCRGASPDCGLKRPFFTPHSASAFRNISSCLRALTGSMRAARAAG